MTTTATKDTFRDLFTCAVQNNVAIPVAAMHSLIYIIKTSKATTWMGLEQDLRLAIHSLKSCNSKELNGYTKISLGSGCDIFMKFVSRAFSMEIKEFQECKNEILRRGEKFTNMSMSARLSIAKIGHSFVEDGFTVFVHGSSRCVSTLLLRVAEDDRMFNVIITEGRPRNDGEESAKLLVEKGIPVTVVPDSAMGAVMDRADLCLVGAEGVMENGGIINKVGTYQMAIVAKAMKKPFYVAVESYKFARMYPFTQQDVYDLCNPSPIEQTVSSVPGVSRTGLGLGSVHTQSAHTPNMSDISTKLEDIKVVYDDTLVDFTPAEYITLLFTDLGVLTPAAVSDELIRLYQ